MSNTVVCMALSLVPGREPFLRQDLKCSSLEAGAPGATAEIVEELSDIA